MATTPKISIRLGLDGKEEVLGGFSEIKSRGLDAFNALKNTAGNALGDGGRKATLQLEQIGLRSIESTKSVEQFREALHVAHPILEQTGLGLSNLGAFAAVARGGLGGLAVAAGGAALVGLANLDNQAKKTRLGLGSLLQSPTSGNKLYADLQEDAKRLGTSVETFSAPLDNLVSAGRRFNEVSGIDNYRKALVSLFEAMRAGGTSDEDAKRGLEAFSAELERAGKLTPEIVDSLTKTSRSGADVLAKALGRPNAEELIKSLQGGLYEGINGIVSALGSVAGASQKAFQSAAKDARTYQDALRELGLTSAELVKDATGKGPDEILTGATDALNGAVDNIRKNVDKVKAAFQPATSPAGEIGAETLPPEKKRTISTGLPGTPSYRTWEVPAEARAPHFDVADIAAAVRGERPAARTTKTVTTGIPGTPSFHSIDVPVERATSAQAPESIEQIPVSRETKTIASGIPGTPSYRTSEVPIEGPLLPHFTIADIQAATAGRKTTEETAAGPGAPSLGTSFAHVLGSLVLGPLAPKAGLPGPLDAAGDLLAAEVSAGRSLPSGATSFLNASGTPPALPPSPPIITFPPESRGLTQFLSGPYAPSAPPLGIPPAGAPAAVASQLSPTISSLNSLLSSLAGAISGAVQRISSTQASPAAGAQTGATEQAGPGAPGQALGGIIGLSAGGSPLGAMPQFRLPTYAKGGHVWARISNGEHFFPPKEVAAIGLPVLHGLNSFAGGGRIHGPGTGTSDSIVASLPRGGFVLNARAAASIGEHTLNHLHAMAEGGHVDFSGVHGSSAPVPALGRDAGGGGGEFHLHWPDGSSTKTPMARDVLDELSQKSALYRLASGGVRSSAQS